MSSNFQPLSIFSSPSSGNAQSTAIDIEPTRFSTIDPSSITKLMKMKDHKLLGDLGGIEGIVSALETDVENGICGDRMDKDSRRRAFGTNLYSEKNLFKCFCDSAKEAMKDPIIIILLVLSILSLGFGIHKHGLPEGWQEGVTKLIAILSVLTVSAIGNFWPANQCLTFSEVSSNILRIDVVRSDQLEQIRISRIVVGDIVFLKPGDQVPGDGLFLDGSSLQVVELKTDGQIEIVAVDSHEKPCLYYGSTVVNGYARMLVTAVGKHRKNHKILLNGRLIEELKRLTSVILKIAKTVAILTFFMLLAQFFAGSIVDENGNRVSLNAPSDILMHIIGIVTTLAMITLTSNPDGLMLAAQFALAHSMRRLMLARCLVRKPSLCHSVASVTTIE